MGKISGTWPGQPRGPWHERGKEGQSGSSLVTEEVAAVSSLSCVWEQQFVQMLL